MVAPILGGGNVADVLDGALLRASKDRTQQVNGVPLTGFIYCNGSVEYYYQPELSHFSLRNSLMSHFHYRNYSVLMEAELAVLQDLGYNIDRKAFFGKSIYNSGTEDEYYKYINYNGYSQRNEAGTAYADGASTVERGMGLHVYGDYVDVTQKGVINTIGRGAVGIRVDGEFSDKVTVDANVGSNGEYGNSLLFAYGTHHNAAINAGATVEATGANGIGARFDFGDNVVGDYMQYEGSYIYAAKDVSQLQRDPDNPEDTKYYMFPTIYNSFECTPDNPSEGTCNGSVVDTFDVRGSLEGNKAAIYMSPNAHVGLRNLSVRCCKRSIGTGIWKDIMDI